MNQYEDVRTIVEEVFKTPAFQDWLRKVQAEAWERGYLDMDADRIHGTGTENPYRKGLQSP